MALVALIAGAVTGLFQALPLARAIARFAWWPLVSAIGWGLLFPGAIPGLFLALTPRRAL